MSARRKAQRAEPKPGRCLRCPGRVRFTDPRNLATGGTMHKRCYLDHPDPLETA